MEYTLYSCLMSLIRVARDIHSANLWLGLKKITSRDGETHSPTRHLRVGIPDGE